MNIAALVSLLIAIIVGALMLMRVREHATAMYERRMAANAHLVSMVRVQTGMRITIFSDGTMELETIADESPRQSDTPSTPGHAVESSDFDALAESARIVKASLGDPKLVERNQIIPANQWSSGENWQRAINAMRARGWLMDVSAAGRTGTFVRTSLTLADLLEEISIARRGSVLDDAVRALPRARQQEVMA